MFNFEELFVEQANKKKATKKITKKKSLIKKKLPKATKSFTQYGGVFENNENKIKIENIKKDWYALDYVFFGEEVTPETHGKSFAQNWKNAKKEVLQKFYEITDYVSLNTPIKGDDVLLESTKKKENSKTRAKKVAKKAKVLAKKTLAKKVKKTKKIAKKLAENIFYPSILNEEIAVNKAVKCIFAIESALHLFGGNSSLINPLVRLFIIYTKQK